MSQEFKGFIVKLATKSGNGKRGRWTLYSAKLEKRDGTEYDDWLSLGFDDPGVKEGDYIAVQANQENGRWKADIKTLQKSKNPPARANKGGDSASAQESRSDSPSSSKRFDGTGIQNRTNPEDARRMAYANARTTAVELVSLLLEHKALPITGAQTKAGEAKRFDEINAAVDKITVKFFNDGTSLRLLETVADTVPSKAPDAALPDTEADGPQDAEPNDDPNDDPPDDEGF